MSRLYEQDFHAWTLEQSRLLREGRLEELDLAHLIEEVESMGRTERRELKSRLALLLAHLLKWRYQPALRGTSWTRTIRVQRKAIAQHLRDNPSLKAQAEETLNDAYELAVEAAEGETGIPLARFPAACPWTFTQVTDPGFWPDEEF